MKNAKRSKISNYDQLKLSIDNMREYYEKALIFKDECRIIRINDKIYKYSIENIEVSQLPELLTKIIFRSEMELDDKDDVLDEMYSEDNDEIFIKNKSNLDNKLEDKGV